MTRRKLKLDVEKLDVLSFEVGTEVAREGTVYGHATLLCTQYASCGGSCRTCINDSCFSCPAVTC